MAEVHAASPYSVREDISQGNRYALRESAEFAAPRFNEDAPVEDSPIGAWAPRLREEIGSTPDPQRLRHMARQDFRPSDGEPSERFHKRLDRDDAERHAVEFQDADGFEIAKVGSGKPAAPNPRATPPPETRPTSRLSPRSYVFTRPMFGGPRGLNGEHFSMADHRRKYDILGMQPVRSTRNTFRADPMPYDTDMVDKPDTDTSRPVVQVPVIEVPLTTPRSFRLV